MHSINFSSKFERQKTINSLKVPAFIHKCPSLSTLNIPRPHSTVMTTKSLSSMSKTERNKTHKWQFQSTTSNAMLSPINLSICPQYRISPRGECAKLWGSDDDRVGCANYWDFLLFFRDVIKNENLSNVWDFFKHGSAESFSPQNLIKLFWSLCCLGNFSRKNVHFWETYLQFS